MLEDLIWFNLYEYEYFQTDVEDYLSGDPNEPDEDGQTLLHKYVLSLDFDEQVMQNIIDRGALLETRNRTGKTALLLAVINRKKNALEVLIRNGADVNVKDFNDNNALHYMALAELNHHFDEWVKDFNFDDTYYILDRLLKEGVDVNAQNRSDGYTPLMLAARGKHLEIVKLLLAFGANVHLSNTRGKTCLHFALFYRRTDGLSVAKRQANDHAILSELVRNQACVNCFEMYSLTPLFSTLGSHVPNNANFARELIKNSALLHWYKKIEFHYDDSTVLGSREDGDLVSFADLCYNEIGKMKKHILPGKSYEEKNTMERIILPRGSNLCEFARKGVTEDDLKKAPGIKDQVLKIILKESFPLYLDLILDKLGKEFLFAKGSSLSLFMRGESEIIHLHSYIFSEICSYLDAIEIFNLLTAFHFEVS